MHGVVNRAVELFLRDTYGEVVWEDISAAARLDGAPFEAMLVYRPGTTDDVIEAAAARIGKPRDALLEDLGIYLVSHRRYEALRRLLRFSGVTFEDFVLSMDELPGRARLALPDLDIVPIRLHTRGPGRYDLCCGPGWRGFGHVLAGALRAMADDYGALITISLLSEAEDGETCLGVTLHETHHSRGRSFELAAQPA